MKKNTLPLFAFLAIFLFSPQETNAQVVVIDAGHGVQSSCTNCDRPDEEVLTAMAVANLLKDTLEANCNWTVQMTRVSNACGQCPTLNQRENMANSWGADRFLSIHGNAGGGTGTETFWCSQGSSSDAAAAAFCDEVQARMVQFGNWTDRRSVEDASYLGFHLGVLNNQNAPACLSEIAFYDNPSDWAIMSQTTNQADYAHAYRVALETDMNTFCSGGTPPTPPANDDCANATTLQSNISCVNTSGTLSEATASGVAQPSCDDFGSPAMLDVWYSFIATATDHDILQTANPNFDGIIALYSACGGNELFCSDDNPIGQNETINATNLTIGNTYYIRVYDYGTVVPTDPTFEICVTGQPNTNAPPNDDCANATTLTSNVNCVNTSGTLENATASGVAQPSCDDFGGPAMLDVWYAFEAIATEQVIEQTPNANFDGVIALYSSCGGSELFARMMVDKV
ncbi:MAG: N-acetylmuramoyl-L-alanine amidase [Flavobacteriales bacterium]|nr:N-acetylmuramoyl-L-alanine amidase [Flavobacteriales bacterium]